MQFKVLALLFAGAQGYSYTITAYNNAFCNGTTIATGNTGSMVNGSVCSAPFFFPDPVTGNTTGVQFYAYCQFSNSQEGIRVYNDMSNCSTGFGCVATNASALLCQNYPTLYPNVSFKFANAGGINACAGLIELEKALAKLLCISGDTALPTRSGTVLAKDLEVGTEILTANGDFKPVQMFWHRTPEEASCLRVCSKASQDCVTVSHEHYIRSSQGFETAETLSSAEFSVEPATCSGLVSFFVEGGSFATKQGGMEISSFSKTWGLSHNALLWLTEWSGILMAPIRDWTFFAEAGRCLSKGAIACALGSLAKLA
jgi:hypothetical protein